MHPGRCHPSLPIVEFRAVESISVKWRRRLSSLIASLNVNEVKIKWSWTVSEGIQDKFRSKDRDIQLFAANPTLLFSRATGNLCRIQSDRSPLNIVRLVNWPLVLNLAGTYRFANRHPIFCCRSQDENASSQRILNWRVLRYAYF